jgi:hypothetical protein
MFELPGSFFRGFRIIDNLTVKKQIEDFGIKLNIVGNR